MNKSINKIEEAYPEIIIGLASAAGTDSSIVIDELIEQLKEFNYTTKLIKISKEIIEPNLKSELNKNAYDRTLQLMDCGNKMREMNGTDIIIKGVASIINSERSDISTNNSNFFGIAYIIDSLKHQDEAKSLKEIYGSSFYLFAINESKVDRIENYTHIKDIGIDSAKKLIKRDENEKSAHGQHAKRVFELADFHLKLEKKGHLQSDSHVNYKKENKKLKTPLLRKQLSRILDLMYGHPYITPTFDEFAMFMAYSSSLRSADLSRQVGAVISKNNNIIATGANDVPRYNGGQYWPNDVLDIDSQIYLGHYDEPGGRDHTIGYDPNKKEIEAIADEILDSFDYSSYPTGKEDYKSALKKVLMDSSLSDLTEFSRAVHAEMAAMLSCSNIGISITGGTLYCTTFPCHNCARHAIFSGIERVVFIEPYLKSKAFDLHKDSISISKEKNKVSFEQFIGVGPRRFFDLFSLKLSIGQDIKRKDKDKIIEFNRNTARIRCESDSKVYELRELLYAMSYAKIYQNYVEDTS